VSTRSSRKANEARIHVVGYVEDELKRIAERRTDLVSSHSERVFAEALLILLTRTMLLGNAREQLEDLMAWAKNRATQEPSESAGAVPFRKCDDCPSHMAAACVEFSRCGLGAFQRQEPVRD
jgi:hypothetical protein